jgi:hypothetical protein
MIYGRSARLPMDQLEEDNQKAENDRLRYLIDEVPQIRQKAKNQVLERQSHNMEKYGLILKTPKFQIGDKVLYFKVT